MVEILTGCQPARKESRWESFKPKEPGLEDMLVRGWLMLERRYSGEIRLQT